MMLLAEIDITSAATLTFVATVAGLFGSGITYLLGWWDKRRQQKRIDQKEDVDNAIARYQAIIDRQDRESQYWQQQHQQCVDQSRQITSDIANQRVLSERAVMWIRYLESSLDNAGIPHPRWDQMVLADTATHTPVAPQPPPPTGAK